MRTLTCCLWFCSSSCFHCTAGRAAGRGSSFVRRCPVLSWATATTQLLFNAHAACALGSLCSCRPLHTTYKLQRAGHLATLKLHRHLAAALL